MLVTYIFSFLCLFSALHATCAQQSALPPMVFSPTANPTYHYSPNIFNEVNPHITCSSTSLSYALAIALRDYAAPWIDKMKAACTKDNYELLKSIFMSFLWKYKFFIAGNTLIGSYVSMTLLLLSDYYFMNENQRWSQWKCALSFEKLCNIPQQQLTKELLLTINQRNFNNNKPTDINHPLITFIGDINHEIYRINRYITIASTQKRLCLIKLFPTNDTKIKRAEQLLTRAHFIKHLFLSWLAEYNVTSGQVFI